MAVLNKQQILEAIENEEIKILCSFEKKENDEIVFQNEKNILDSQFEKNLYSDRLKLTLGPVIKVLQKQHFNSKNKFKNNKDCIDIRQSSNVYVIQPRESIVILTNERICLNGKYVALIFPRVSLSEVGIIVTPAYIDAYYNGLLRLNVTNNSKYPFELKALEVIAQCFFFRFSESVSEEYKDSFSEKSVFIGQNWNAIINEDRLPFPTKKNAKDENSFINNIKYQIMLAFSIVKKYSLFVAVLTYVSTIIGMNYSINEYKETTNHIVENFKSDFMGIIIEPGKSYGEKEVILDLKKEDILTVLCNNDMVNYRLLNGSREDETILLFYYHTDKEQVSRYEINFTYTVVRRIDN